MFTLSGSNCLWYKKEATYFEEALPLGNGKIGAMVYGGVNLNKIGLNHDELWTGLPGDGLNNVKKESFFKARELALENKFYECNRLLDEEFCKCARVNAYMPLGDMLVETDFKTVSEYKRMLFLRPALTREEFVADGIEVLRECFISFPQNCLVWRNVTTKKSDFTIKITTQLEGSATVTGDVITLTGVTPIYAPRQLELDACDITVKGEHGMRFCSRLKVITDGKTESDGESIRVTEATNTVVILVAETSYNGFDKNPLTEGKNEITLTKEYLEKASKLEYNMLLKNHIDDVTKYYDLVYFTLNEEENLLPTYERLKLFDGGKGEKDDGLYVLLFNFGRYLTIAGSRKGSQPMNLQGIWNNLTAPPWESDFHTNINIQMNYFPTLQIGLTEMTEPLETLIRNISVHGRKTAERLYGARGFVCHHNSDVYANTGAIKGQAVYSFWYFGSGWLLRHLFDKYKYTNDLNYLKEIYPLMRDGAAFYLDMLCDVDGFRAPCPATSPENSFFENGKWVATAKTTTMAVSIVRDLFKNCLEAAKILNIDDEIIREIRQELPRLLPMHVLSDGRLEEFYFGKGIELEECEPTHRHVSHLYALYPAKEKLDNEILDAIRLTLDKRGDESTGWALAWRICLFANLKDGDRALNFINRLLVKAENKASADYHGNSGVYANLFDAHPPFQIDGNFGYVAGICEMLVQCENDEVIPLPALPNNWKNGEIKGLRVPNGRAVDILWRDGKVAEFKVKHI